MDVNFGKKITMLGKFLKLAVSQDVYSFSKNTPPSNYKSNFMSTTSIIITVILEYHQLSTEAKTDILWYWRASSMGKDMDDGWWNPTNDDEDDYYYNDYYYTDYWNH